MHSASILELVDHEVIDLCACLFVDERRVTSGNHPVQQFRCVGNQHHVLFFAIGRDLIGYIGENAQCIIVTDDLAGGVVVCHLLKAGNGFLDALIQSVLESCTNDCFLTGIHLLGKACLQIIGKATESHGWLFDFTRRPSAEMEHL